MKKNLLFITILLSVIFLIFGCTSQFNLADYQPKSAEEKEVLDFMIEFDRAYYDRNLTETMACFHDSATIIGPWGESGRRAKTILTKQQYEDRLRDGAWGSGRLKNPKINIMGDRATANFRFRNETGYTIFLYFDLVQENEEWSITKYEWTWR